MDFTNPYPRLSDVEQNVDLEIEGNFVRFKEMVTPGDIRRHGLIGVPKQFPLTGEEITDEYIALHLQNAIAELEMMGMMFSPVISHHIDDLMSEGITGQRFFPSILKRFPVREIESIELRYPNAMRDDPSLVYRIPDEWITFENGKVNVIATTGFLTPNLVSGSANIPLVNLFQTNYKPSGYRVNYKAGFDQDKLPVIAWHLLIDLATMYILHDIGPMMFSSTGVNVGIDGVSQSAQLPGPRIFEARISSLKERTDRNRDLIASYYGSAMTMEFSGL